MLRGWALESRCQRSTLALATYYTSVSSPVLCGYVECTSDMKALCLIHNNSLYSTCCISQHSRTQHGTKTHSECGRAVSTVPIHTHHTVLPSSSTCISTRRVTRALVEAAQGTQGQGEGRGNSPWQGLGGLGCKGSARRGSTLLGYKSP